MERFCRQVRKPFGDSWGVLGWLLFLAALLLPHIDHSLLGIPFWISFTGLVLWWLFDMGAKPVSGKTALISLVLLTLTWFSGSGLMFWVWWLVYWAGMRD